MDTPDGAMDPPNSAMDTPNSAMDTPDGAMDALDKDQARLESAGGRAARPVGDLVVRWDELEGVPRIRRGCYTTPPPVEVLMRGKDIPQANSLDRVREVVQVVQGGARTPVAVQRLTELSPRHASYYLQAARVLGLLRNDGDNWAVSESGRRLLATAVLSDAESMVFRQVIRDSPVVKELVPGLLEEQGESLEKLTIAIMEKSGLAMATAKRRAQALHAWRDRVLSPAAVQRSLFDFSIPASAPDEPRSLPIREGVRVSSITIRRYGPIRELTAPLRPSTVIIGRNATGKSTFMDSLVFVSDALNGNIEDAIQARTTLFEELLWARKGESFQFSFDFSLPEEVRPSDDVPVARYELKIGVTPEGTIGNLGERLVLLKLGSAGAIDDMPSRRPTKAMKGRERLVVSMSAKGVAWFGSERSQWKTVITLGSRKLALGEVQDEPRRFPAALRVRDFLRFGVQRLALQPRAMMQPCSPRSPRIFLPDGSNLPIVVAGLRHRDLGLYKEWLEHLQEALPDVAAVAVRERADDRHLYLKLTYKNGLELPAWRLSEGTLRIIALTLIPFAANADGIYLIEEPENGVHPQAVEAVHQALSHPVRIQIVVATHSPVFVGIVAPDDLLCFSVREGSTVAVPGSQHPALRDWRQEIDLGTLFATRVLE